MASAVYDRRVPDPIDADAAEDRRAAGRRAWRAARGFDALCALGAAFLERRCAHFPGWGAADPDVETDAIVAPLVALHAHGFLSVASQPGFAGTRDGRDVRQRAFVAGFARPALAQRIAASPRVESAVYGAWNDLDTFANPSRSSLAPDASRSMTTVDGVARVVAGEDAREEELALFADDLDAAALRELRAAAYVVAWDPEFGRDDVLWDALLDVARG